MSPHDALFRTAFGPVASAAALLQAVLPTALVARIRWDTLRQGTPRFLDEALGVHEADLVFTALDVDGVHVHVFVVEHKSSLRRHTVFQPLRYVVRALEGWVGEQSAGRRRGLAAGPGEPMPRVHAVVVHHGPRRSRALLDAVRQLPPDAGAHDPESHGSLRFRVHLEDLSRVSESQILTRAMPPRARLALLFLQHLPRKGSDQAARAMLRWQSVLCEAFGGDGGEDEFGVFAAYALQVTDVDPEVLRQIVARMLRAERGETVMYTADRLRLEGRKLGLEEGLKRGWEKGVQEGLERGMERGLERGIDQGIEQGEDQAMRASLLRLLQLRFGDAARRATPQVEAAPPEQVRRWFDRAVLAATFDEVFREPG